MPNTPETDEEKQRDPNAPGGYEGFDSYFNANKATSQAGANKYAGIAQGSVDQAASALQKTQNDFNSQLNTATNVGAAAGYPGGPRQRPGAGVPASNVGSMAPAPAVPGSLGDVASFQTAADKANKASETLNQLGLVGMGGLDANGNARGDLQTLVDQQNPNSSTGANQLSANLIGSAGRAQFDALSSHFNPVNDLNQAVTKSATDSQAAQQKLASERAAVAASRTGLPAPEAATGEQPTDINPLTDADAYIKKYGYAAYSDAVGRAFNRS